MAGILQINLENNEKEVKLKFTFEVFSILVEIPICSLVLAGIIPTPSGNPTNLLSSSLKSIKIKEILKALKFHSLLIHISIKLRITFIMLKLHRQSLLC